MPMDIRKPQASAFLAETQAPKPVAKLPRGKGPIIRAVHTRTDGTTVAKLTAVVSLEIGTKVKAYCFQNGLELSAFVGGLIEKHIAELGL